MADAVKAQKLAAARKRLKEYQKTQSKQKNVRNTDEETLESTQKVSLASETVTPVDSMASSTHSCFENTTSVVENNLERNQHSFMASDDASFFNTALFQQPSAENNHILSNYFDKIPQDTTITNDLLATADVECTNAAQNVQYADPFDSVERKQAVIRSPTDHVTVEAVNTTSPGGEPTILSTQTSEDTPVPESGRTQSECALPQPTTSNGSSTNENQNLFSNTESLRQLSTQLNSLIDNSEAPATNIRDSTSASELERRNQELAALLKAEQMKNDQLSLQVREYVTRIAQLDAESGQLRNEHEAKLTLQVGPLQEQLDYHMKAFGILVGERTELQMALGQCQVTAKQKTSECEELHGRLKASRHRVAELEKEANHLKSLKDNADRYDQENSREFERLRLECNLLKEQCDEAAEDASELREKLNAKVTECLLVQQEVQQKHSQLALAHLKLVQLTNGDSAQVESQIEILNQRNIAMEQQIAELTQTVKTVSAERDHASQQYQQYVQQLNAQIQSLAERLETKNSETEVLAGREQSLVKHIGELERHLQQLQSEKVTTPGARVDNSSAEIKRLEAALSALQTEKLELEQKYQEESDNKQTLESDVREKCELIVQLENMVERLKDQPDATKLLAAMESDKVAARRAVEQNKKLKEQLEELHDGFIKMSNSKLELTESLQSETHRATTLSDQLTERHAAVEHLHQVIATKDEQLTALHDQTTELQKQILHQHQLADRLRHYEAQGNTSDHVQHELQQAQHALQKLTAENEELRKEIEKLPTTVSEVTLNANKMAPTSPSLTEAARDSVANGELQQTAANEMELLKDHIEILEKLNGELQTQLNTTETADDEMPQDARLDKERAMEQLEARFTKTMVDVANLTEEKQRLEHLVLQLQSETETIGEYVALYQCQRALMKEKTLEKDEQLRRLAHDREEMKHKLAQLNALVQRLVVEQGIITSDALLSLHSCPGNDTDVNKLQTTDSGTTEQSAVNGGNHDNNNVDGTAGKIIALLSEIKTSNLVQPPGDGIQNFHPCPLCSGQLITV